MSEVNPPQQNTAATERIENWLRRFLHEHYKRYYNLNNTKYRLLTRLLFITAGLALVAGALLVVRPYYRYHKEQRAVALAQAFLQQGDLRNAQLRARQALALNPANVAATRLLAQIAAAAHSPEELAWRQRVAGLEPTLENKLLLAEAGLHQQPPPFPITATVFNGLGTIVTTNARCQNIAFHLAMGRNAFAEAEAHLAAAVRLDPTNAHYLLNLAIVRLALTNEQQRAESREQLRQLCADPVYGPEALRGLIKDRLAQKDWATANDYSMRLLASPAATLRDRLQNLDILRQRQSGDLAKRLQAVWTSAETNAPAVAAISAWMQASGLLAENRLWLEDLPALENQQPVELALANVYEQSGDWHALLDYTSHGNWGNLDYLRLAAAAHAATQLKMTDVAHGNWDSAVREAAGRPDDLRQLVLLAAHWQFKPETTDLLERLVHDFPGDDQAVGALTLCYVNAGNTPALQQLYTRMCALEPTNFNYQVTLAGASLLLQTNVDEAGQWLAGAHAQAPGNFQVTALDAYALHLQRRDAEGLAEMATLAPTNLARPYAALYYGVLLNSAGKPREAAKWLHLAQTKEIQFLPEEKQLLASALAGR